MKYLVVLNADSPTGRIFESDNDGFVRTSGASHPALACTDLTMDSPYYIFAKRQPTGGEPHQSLYLPHDSVLMIFRYAEDEPNPLGFVLK